MTHGLDVDESGRPAVERVPGAGHGDDPSPEGSALGDTGDRPEPDAHLEEPEGGRRRQPDTRHLQLCAQRTLSQRHAFTLGVRQALPQEFGDIVGMSHVTPKDRMDEASRSRTQATPSHSRTIGNQGSPNNSGAVMRLRPRHPIRWALGVIAVAVALIVGGTFVFMHFIVGEAPAPLAVSTSPAIEPATGSVAGSWQVTKGSQAGYRVAEDPNGQSNTAVGRTAAVTGGLTATPTKVTEAKFAVDLTQVASDQARRDTQFQDRIMQRRHSHDQRSGARRLRRLRDRQPQLRLRADREPRHHRGSAPSHQGLSPGSVTRNR